MPRLHWITRRLFRFRAVHPVTGEALEVEAEYFPPRRGGRDREGFLLEPGELEELLIREVRTKAGRMIRFGDCEEALEKTAWVLLAADGDFAPGRRGWLPGAVQPFRRF